MNQRDESARSDRMSGIAPLVILLMEDDLGLAHSMGRVLELEGYRVLKAENGRIAYEIAEREERIDLLIADLVLPGLSGREAANLIVAHHPEVTVMFTTGFTSAAPELKELLESGLPVLRKPYTVPSLVEAVKSALQS